MNKKPPKEDFVFDGFEPANTTPVPDVLFDVLLSELTGTELKILLYIIRRTWGFKKDADAISLSQFQKGITTKDGKVLDRGSGISDRKTVLTTLASLESKGCIQIVRNKTASGDNATSVYRINFKGVVGKTNHLNQGVVGKTNQGSGKNQPGVVGKTNPQETVIQQTDSQETVIESIANEVSAVEPSAPNVALSLVSQSSLSSFPQEETQEEQSPIVKAATRNGQYKPSSKKKEEKAEPIMPLQDAPWPSRETAVQIVEAKKGRKYSDATRKQELQEAGKVLDMAIDGVLITREQFESAWDDLASSSWWDEHGKPCMIKYLRRDDTIVGIVKKLKRKVRPSSTSQATIVDMDAERERARIKNEQQLVKQQEMRRKRAEAVAQGVKNG